MSSCLTAFYRLNPRHVIHSLIPECSSEKAPIAFKLVLVTCFYTIASEEDRLPWNPSIQPASSALGAPLRKLFAENVIRERVADVLARKTISDRKLKRQNVELAKDKQELIIYLLKMYQIDPVLAVAVSCCLILDRSTWRCSRRYCSIETYLILVFVSPNPNNRPRTQRQSRKRFISCSRGSCFA